MQINSERYLAETDLRPMVTAAVLTPAVTAVAQGGPPPSPLPTDMMRRQCEDQEARFAARMAFPEAKIALKPEQRSEWEAFVAAEEPTRDPCASPPPLQATYAVVARLKEKLAAERQRRLAKAFLSPSVGLRVFRAFGSPGMGPPGLSLGPPGFAAYQPPAPC
jgi:hypothetical protein